VHRATHRIGLYLDKLGEPGLTQGEAHILAMLAHSGPAKVAELNRGLAHKRSTLTSILDRLAKRNLITREVGKTDRRTFIVTLTAKGRKLAHRISSHLLELEREVARGVTAADIKGFKGGGCLRAASPLSDTALTELTVGAPFFAWHGQGAWCFGSAFDEARELFLSQMRLSRSASALENAKLARF
jgi:DNA-binding MarR family transcriptional regulator